MKMKCVDCRHFRLGRGIGFGFGFVLYCRYFDSICMNYWAEDCGYFIPKQIESLGLQNK